ncbi:hypothetical protein AZE42_05803 [Rhizopogon vesiculosus]|uniref:Uncharacterized protein n=1 Tax=Rhizopogon vesiculosus TaxID=180088 RepID=A0A1J8QH80_9AGAM|nr:hypothetical protein AZE42_05803 [Rhizopogon vesiculosus]
MPSPVINITIHKQNTMQFRHVGAEHPIYSRVLELAKALVTRDGVDDMVTPDELLPSHASFLAILNATTAVLQHCGLHLSRLDPLSRQRTVCFTINLNHMVVNDVSLGSDNISDFPLPVSEGVLMELRDFVIGQVSEWKRDEESQRHEQETKWKQEQERRRADTIAFLRRLAKLDLVGPGVLESDVPTDVCPLCSRDLVRCRVCGVHTCENSTCQASSIVSVVACSYHDQEFFCIPCATDHSPAAGQCPICSRWCCMAFLNGCVGQPEGVAQWRRGYNCSPDERFHPISDLSTDDRGLNHAHPPKIAPCQECVREGHASAWHRCNNNYCWSRSHNHMGDMICSDCAPGGQSCACSRTWICELCSTDQFGMPFAQCPSCKAVYCQDWCAYIQTCIVCSSTRLCDDCIEEEPEADAGQSQLRNPLFTEKCGICRQHICDACAPCMTKCSSCDHLYCTQCKWNEEWFSCKTCSNLMCKDCIRNWDDCRKCTDAKYPSYNMGCSPLSPSVY